MAVTITSGVHGHGGGKVTRIANITSSDVALITDINKDAMIRAFPTSAGSATGYSTGSIPSLMAADAAAGNAAIVANTNAQWQAWTPGAVVADTISQALMPISGFALVVASGTWVLEVCQ